MTHKKKPPQIKSYESIGYVLFQVYENIGDKIEDDMPNDPFHKPCPNPF